MSDTYTREQLEQARVEFETLADDITDGIIQAISAEMLARGLDHGIDGVFTEVRRLISIIVGLNLMRMLSNSDSGPKAKERAGPAA